MRLWVVAFAFRVHTHALGRRVWLERLAAGADSNPVELMGRDPQLAGRGVLCSPRHPPRRTPSFLELSETL